MLLCRGHHCVRHRPEAGQADGRDEGARGGAISHPRYRCPGAQEHALVAHRTPGEGRVAGVSSFTALVYIVSAQYDLSVWFARCQYYDLFSGLLPEALLHVLQHTPCALRQTRLATVCFTGYCSCSSSSLSPAKAPGSHGGGQGLNGRQDIRESGPHGRSGLIGEVRQCVLSMRASSAAQVTRAAQLSGRGGPLRARLEAEMGALGPRTSPRPPQTLRSPSIPSGHT